MTKFTEGIEKQCLATIRHTKRQGGIMKTKGYKSYKNPDKRCKYVWSPCAVGYCWGYAIFFDELKNMAELKKRMLKFCKNCEFWKRK